MLVTSRDSWGRVRGIVNEARETRGERRDNFMSNELHHVCKIASFVKRSSVGFSTSYVLF